MQKSSKSRKSKKNRGKSALGVPGGRSASLALVIEPWMPVFPATITKRLRYADTVLLVSTTGAVATYVIRANDCFDPDYTGTGHQPMGFDQLILWYNHFCVVRAKLIMICRNTTANTGTVCVRVDGAATPLTVINRIIEVGGCALDDLGINGSATDTKEIQLEVDIAKLQGVNRKAITADSTLRGDAATSPTEVTYFHMQTWNSLAATFAAEIDFIIEQEVVFTEPRDLIESLRSKPAVEVEEKHFCPDCVQTESLPEGLVKVYRSPVIRR